MIGEMSSRAGSYVNHALPIWSFPSFYVSFRLVRNRPDCAMGFPTSGNDMWGGNDM